MTHFRRAGAQGFYPTSPDDLRVEVDSLLVPGAPKMRVIAGVVPHAGYQYSGKVAGAVFSKIEFPDTFVIVGPDHTGLGADGAIMIEGAWETPHGKVEIDVDLAQTILSRTQALESGPLGHPNEHSIEVQLPLLQGFNRRFQFVPIHLSPNNEYPTCEDIGHCVAEAIQASKKSVVVVASTDMTHCGRAYQLPPRGMAAHEFAIMQDRKAIEAILALNPAKLYMTARQEQVSMCGLTTTTSTLVAAKELGGKGVEIISYRTSGDVTKDSETVVGYAGILIH